MKNCTKMALPVLLAVLAPHANAQSISPAWDAYRKTEAQEAKPQEQPRSEVAPLSDAPSAGSYQAAPAAVPPPPASYSRVGGESKGGIFLGAQAGKGWIYEDVDQSALAINGGYRWQAGAVTLIGIELASGRLSSTQDDGYHFPQVRYGSVGANARFNFGEHNPWFAIARLGYWAADGDGDDESDVDGGYASFGVGVDVNRHFNVNLAYTNFAYATSYYSSNGYYYGTEVNRADMVMLGVEARF